MPDLLGQEEYHANARASERRTLSHHGAAGKSVLYWLEKERAEVHITAHVSSSLSSHTVWVSTDGNSRPLEIPPEPNGQGSAVNGGELLMLALATCYCNDVYREAARLKIQIDKVDVEASADFAGVGLAASNIRYRARVSSPADDEHVAALLRETDAVAEIHNTVRKGVPVQLLPWSTE